MQTAYVRFLFAQMWPPEDKEPPEGIPDEKEEQYRVSVDWLIDADDWNEWMCEEDYEVEESGDGKVSDMFMGEDEFANCFEKPKKRMGKRRRSPSPAARGRGGGRGKG